MEMFSRLEGLASSRGFLSPFLLAFSLESCIRVPSLCILYLSCTLLGLRSLGMAYVCFTFLVPCWTIPLERWQCLLYFPAHVIVLCMMYVYLYMLVCG